MLKDFWARHKRVLLERWLDEFSSGPEEAIRKIATAGGTFYFVPAEGEELPAVKCAMFKSLADEGLPNRTKVVLLLGPAGERDEGLICQIEPELPSEKPVPKRHPPERSPEESAELNRRADEAWEAAEREEEVLRIREVVEEEREMELWSKDRADSQSVDDEEPVDLETLK